MELDTLDDNVEAKKVMWKLLEKLGHILSQSNRNRSSRLVIALKPIKINPPADTLQCHSNPS